MDTFPDRDVAELVELDDDWTAWVWAETGRDDTVGAEHRTDGPAVIGVAPELVYTVYHVRGEWITNG